MTRPVPELYLDLLEQTLTGIILNDPGYLPSITPGEPSPFDPNLRATGLDWPLHAQTMVGIPRLKNLRQCIAQVIAAGVPGDFIETGVWRGGACIYMRANLALHGDTQRTVWVADSFEGLPPPDATNFPIDQHDELHKVKVLAVSIDEVRANFQKYGLLDNQVRFLKGFFKDSLPTAPIERLAILRLDGDMYESTMQALDALYHKLSPGGFVIVDDYSLPPCQKAIIDFRVRHNIAAEIITIDHASVYWRKPY